MKHKKNKHTYFSYVVLTRNYRDIGISISTRRTDMFVFLVLMLMHVAVIPSEDNIRKTTVCSCIYAYVAAVTSVMLMPMR